MQSVPTDAFWTILAAGLMCGVLDGLSAIGVWMVFRVKPIRVFQGIASGVLGPDAFQRDKTAALGVAVHFLVSFAAASVYYTASRVFSDLNEHALLSGVVFGLAVRIFMSFVVIPLSAMRRRFMLRPFLAILVVHLIVVGPSISLTVRHYSR
jgi:uncharacterized membrane protein YagU involved in acid resistance